MKGVTDEEFNERLKEILKEHQHGSEHDSADCESEDAGKQNSEVIIQDKMK